MLYRFDKKLRLLLFNEIEKIEIAVRCTVVISKNILSKKRIAINFRPQKNSFAPKLGQNHRFIIRCIHSFHHPLIH